MSVRYGLSKSASLKKLLHAALAKDRTPRLLHCGVACMSQFVSMLLCACVCSHQQPPLLPKASPQTVASESSELLGIQSSLARPNASGARHQTARYPDDCRWIESPPEVLPSPRCACSRLSLANLRLRVDARGTDKESMVMSKWLQV